MEEQILLNMVRRLESLERRMVKVETKVIVKESELPEHILAEANLLPPAPTATKRGMGYRPLLKSEIEQVKTQCPTMAACARRLQVSFKTLKKYAKLFGIWEPSR